MPTLALPTIGPLTLQALLLIALSIILFVTVFQSAVLAIVSRVEDVVAQCGALALRAIQHGLGGLRTAQEPAVGLAEDGSETVPPRRPHIILRLIGASLSVVFIAIMTLVDWGALTLALQGMLGIGTAVAAPARWVALLDKSMAIAILAPILYAGWHLAELYGHCHLLALEESTSIWRRAHKVLAITAVVLGVTCALIVALYRGLSLSEGLSLTPDTGVGLSGFARPLTVLTMVTMIGALLASSLLAFESGVIGMLRLLPQITLRALQGSVWLLAVVWTNLFAFARSVIGLLIRIGMLILRIPHSAFVLLNRWGLQTRGAWRVLGAPVAIVTGIVHELDIETDARLDQLLPPRPVAGAAASGGTQVPESEKVFA